MKKEKLQAHEDTMQVSNDPRGGGITSSSLNPPAYVYLADHYGAPSVSKIIIIMHDFQ